MCKTVPDDAPSCLDIQIMKCESGKTFADIDTSDFLPILPLALKRTLTLNLSNAVLKMVNLAWHPDSRHMVTVDQAGKTILWDSVSKSVRQYIKRPHGISVALSPKQLDIEDKVIVAIGGLDNAISVVDMSPSLKTGETLVNLPAVGETHDGLISSLAFLNDGCLASAGGDGEVRLWDVARGKTTTVLRGHTRDCTKLALHRPEDGSAARIATSSLDGTVRVWDARAPGCATHVFEHEDEGTCVTFFPSGNIVAAGCGDGAVHVFDMRRPDKNAALQTLRGTTKSKCGTRRCTGLDCSSSGRSLFTSHEDGTLCTWEPFGAKAGLAHYTKPYNVNPGYEAQQPLVGVTMNPNKDALAVACCDGAARVFTVKGSKK